MNENEGRDIFSDSGSRRIFAQTLAVGLVGVVDELLGQQKNTGDDYDALFTRKYPTTEPTLSSIPQEKPSAPLSKDELLQKAIELDPDIQKLEKEKIEKDQQMKAMVALDPELQPYKDSYDKFRDSWTCNILQGGVSVFPGLCIISLLCRNMSGTDVMGAGPILLAIWGVSIPISYGTMEYLVDKPTPPEIYMALGARLVQIEIELAKLKIKYQIPTK